MAKLLAKKQLESYLSGNKPRFDKYWFYALNISYAFFKNLESLFEAKMVCWSWRLSVSQWDRVNSHDFDLRCQNQGYSEDSNNLQMGWNDFKLHDFMKTLCLVQITNALWEESFENWRGVNWLFSEGCHILLCSSDPEKIATKHQIIQRTNEIKRDTEMTETSSNKNSKESRVKLYEMRILQNLLPKIYIDWLNPLNFEVSTDNLVKLFLMDLSHHVWRRKMDHRSFFKMWNPR